jgi:1-acyl-sn-glycerol-3-phosphate acyltransferase
MSDSVVLSLENIYETLAISWPTVIDALRGRLTKKMCDDRLEGWSKNIVANAEITVTVEGREHLEETGANGRHAGTFLVMSNHQSLYDIPVLFYVIGPNIRMVTKKELFGVPVFGGALSAAGFVKIDRSDREAAIRSLDDARALLASGTHVWIAPEGTRSKSGELGSFKKGAFYLAFEAGLPILPVTLKGTRDVLAAKGVASHAGASVKVTIHEKIDPRPYTERGKDGREALMNEVRRAIESAL